MVYQKQLSTMAASREDTIKAVREVISYGIGVIGIFIGDERQSMHAKKMPIIFLDAW